MDPIAVKFQHSQEVCWICERPDRALFDLTVEQSEKLMRLSQLQPNHDKPVVTRSLCEDCIERLDEAYWFVRQCVEAENRLQISIAQQEQQQVKIEPEDAEEIEPTIECSLLEFKPELEELQEDMPPVDEQEKDTNEIVPVKSREKPKYIRPKKDYRCTVCDKVFGRMDSFKLHQDMHQGIKRYSCESCGMKFAQKGGLKRHEENIHQNIKSFVCNVCGHAFNEKHQLKAHEFKHMEKNVACEQCPMRFKSAERLSRHMVQHNPEAKKEKRMRFKSAESMSRHMVQHDPEAKREKRQFECDICHKTLGSSSVLQNHKKIHAEPGFICSVCGKRFTTGNLLKLHMRSHSDERPFACDICPGKFKWEKTLQDHKLIHTKEKPYQCDLCERRFRTRSQFRNHRFLHTGLRPHVCPICSKDFNRPWNLRLHMKTHAGRVPDDGEETKADKMA
ncbi:zinc finger protein 836 isoform X1 [Culex pipiens pallens]|nr:zinc finger protein 836 isoform X1 [Culex pipiens pallens]